MIIGGGSRSNARWFAKHLMNGRNNEQVRVTEIRGLPVDNIVDALEEMRLIASASPQCKKFFYHADLNTRADELLTEQEWGTAIDTLERNLGLEGQSRFVVEHDKNGRIHRHVIWSRIDPDTMRAIPDSNNYGIHMRTADELEMLFGHEPTPRGRGPDGLNPKNYEVFRGKESGIDPYDVNADLTHAWRSTDNGHAFAAAIDEHGYVLARGDKRGYVVLDPAGDVHSVPKRIAGVRTKDVNARFKDLPLDDLPSVQEARKLARERAAERKERDERDEHAQREEAKHAPPPLADPSRKKDHTGLEHVAEALLDAAHDALGGKEKPAPERPGPAAEHTPGPPPTAFERLAQEAMAVASPPVTEPTRFDVLAREALTVAEEAAPVLLAGTETALGAEAAPQEAARELSAFERFTEWLQQAVHGRAGEQTAAEAIDFMQQTIPPPPAPVPEWERTPFDRFTEATWDAARENGGDPEPGFRDRAVALLTAARDAVEWVGERVQTFVGQLLQNRNSGRDDQSELER